MLLMALCGLPGPAFAVDLTGQIRLLTESGRGSARGAGESPIVVFYEPDRGGEAPKPQQLVVETRRKQFQPRVIVVTQGSSIRFPNRDPILHNVFSVTRGNTFDLGLYRRSAGETVTFDTPGLVRVYCNIHQEMVSFVWVVSTPYFALADADGEFRLSSLPAGPGTLTLWHERSDLKTLRVERPGGGPIHSDLTLSKPRAVKHLNKFGRSYRRSRRDRY